MLSVVEVLDLFDTIVRCGGFENSVPCSYAIEPGHMIVNLSFKQGLEFVQKTLVDPRFKALCVAILVCTSLSNLMVTSMFGLPLSTPRLTNEDIMQSLYKKA